MFDDDSRPDSDPDDATDTETVALSAYALFVHPHPVITASAGSSLPPPMPVTPNSDFIPSFDCDLTSVLRSLIDDRQFQSAHPHLNPTLVEALVCSKLSTVQVTYIIIIIIIIITQQIYTHSS